MGNLQRRIRKNIIRGRRTKREDAEAEVFRFLEERWAEELNDEPIPPKHRGVMRRDPAFVAMVAKALRGEGLSAPDLDVTPTERRKVNGEPRSLFLEEMGGDPRTFFCRTCGSEPVDEAGAQCQDCSQLYPEE